MRSNIAAFCLCRDEPHHLQRWLRHYTRFGIEHLYVLDHGSSGDNKAQIHQLCYDNNAFSIPVYGCNVYAADWLIATAKSFQSFLLTDFDFVLFSAVDELVVPSEDDFADLWRPTPRALILGSVGVEVVDSRIVEDVGGYPSYCCNRYSKPVFSNVPINWSTGFHQATNVREQYSNAQLTLLHMHKWSFNEVSEKNNRLFREPWCEQTWHRTPIYQHNKLIEPKNVMLWMLSNADNTKERASFQPLNKRLVDVIDYATANDDHSRACRYPIPYTYS